MPEITCATCGMPIDPSESTGQGIDGHMHLHVDRCVELLKAENAALKHAIEYRECAESSAFEHAKELVLNYKAMCARFQETAHKHKLGFGGEHVGKVVCEAVDRLISENAALRDDKARMDRLEYELRGLMFRNVTIETDEDSVTAVFGNPRNQDDGRQFDIHPTIRGALDKAFVRLDAARKGGKG